MLKDKEQGREITTSFAGVGLYGTEGELIRVPPGAAMPPCLELNSKPHLGILPHNVRTFDPLAYAKANQPRPEPPAPVMLIEADIKRQKGWTDEQWHAAAANGFPPSHAYRELYDDIGYPTGRLALWSADEIKKWEQAIEALRLG